MSKKTKTHEVDMVTFSKATTSKAGQEVEVEERVLQVIDQEGNKFYFKNESVRNLELWKWKVEMALDEQEPDRVAALPETRRWVLVAKLGRPLIEVCLTD